MCNKYTENITQLHCLPEKRSLIWGSTALQAPQVMLLHFNNSLRIPENSHGAFGVIPTQDRIDHGIFCPLIAVDGSIPWF